MSFPSHIAELMSAIPAQKENLRKSFETLKSHSSSLQTPLPLEWEDLESHFSSMERSIKDRLVGVLQDKQPTAAMKAEIASKEEPQTELRSLCAGMESKRLSFYICANIDNVSLLNHALVPALRCAPDPALLVLDAVDRLFPARFKKHRKAKAGRACVVLLTKLRALGFAIEDSMREKAKKLALEWMARIREGEAKVSEIAAFLRLVLCYNLVSEFDAHLLVSMTLKIWRGRKGADLIEGFQFADKLPDLISELNSKGRQLDSVKLIYALNVVDKYPTIPLFEAYISESKKNTRAIQTRDNNSTRSKHRAPMKERTALKRVLKAVREYKLEAEYPCERLVEKIAQLKNMKSRRNRDANPAARKAAAAVSETQPSIATSEAAVASSSHPSWVQTQQGIGIAAYARSLQAWQHLPLADGCAGTHTSLRPDCHRSSSVARICSQDNQPVTYDGHALSGLPSYHGSYQL